MADVANDPLCYGVREELDTSTCEYSLILPSGFTNNDLATAHVERVGGDSPEDREFRKTLYYLIGMGVVKAGQIEDGMKRLLILTGKHKAADFSIVDLTWSALHDELKKRANRDGPPVNNISLALRWAEDHKIKETRDNLIHASWWDFSDVGARCSRFPRRTGSRMIVGQVDDLKRSVQLLGQYETMIDECVGQTWPRVYLPAKIDGETERSGQL